VIQDEAGKLNLNWVKTESLERLLTLLRASEAQRAGLLEMVHKRLKPRSGDGAPQPPSPFNSVEELVHAKGVGRELIFGSYRREQDGTVIHKRGLVDFVTVHVQAARVNANSAEPEVLASLPGMDLSSARSLVEARRQSPFTSANLAQRTSGILSSEAASIVTATASGCYSLVATAWIKGSKTRRSVRVVARLNSGSRYGHQRLAWYDEHWPSQEILKWIDFSPDRDSVEQTALGRPLEPRNL